MGGWIAVCSLFENARGLLARSRRIGMNYRSSLPIDEAE